MQAEQEHARAVADWQKKALANYPSDRQVDHFCHAFNTIWRRAGRTLGESTLVAIGDRALFLAGEHYRLFSDLTLTEEGIQSAQLRQKADEMSPPEREKAFIHALTRFLTLLGSLTAEILTPALHAELRNLAPRNNAPLHPDGFASDADEEGQNEQ